MGPFCTTGLKVNTVPAVTFISGPILTWGNITHRDGYISCIGKTLVCVITYNTVTGSGRWCGNRVGYIGLVQAGSRRPLIEAAPRSVTVRIPDTDRIRTRHPHIKALYDIEAHRILSPATICGSAFNYITEYYPLA